LSKATANLNEASHAADENERGRKSLESRNKADKERIIQLEKQIAELGAIAEESDKRYDDVSLFHSLFNLNSSLKCLLINERLQTRSQLWKSIWKELKKEPNQLNCNYLSIKLNNIN
jgi:hypothetical protein